MLDIPLMESVATQMMEGTLAVNRTSYQRLKTMKFQMDGREYQAIEQNASKPSRWGQLAREGHRVVQFRDVATGKYIAVAVDGKVQPYGS